MKTANFPARKLARKIAAENRPWTARQLLEVLPPFARAILENERDVRTKKDRESVSGY